MVIFSKLSWTLADTIRQTFQVEKNDGTLKSPSSDDIHNLVLYVHSLLAHGAEGGIRMENGHVAVIPRTAPFHALLLRLHEVAQRTLSISTDHLSGWAEWKTQVRMILIRITHGATKDTELIRIGRLLPGGERVNEGQHRPIKGFAEISNGIGTTEELVVFAKELELRALSVELVCAAIGRLLNLPIPEPLLLADESGKYYFGSVDAAYPSFHQYIVDHDDKGIKERLAQWPLLKAAAFFDEWIAMDDRSNGNILFNGETFALIDHESAISSQIQHDCFGIDYYSNQLLQVAISGIDYSDELLVQKTANEANSWVINNATGSFETLNVDVSNVIADPIKLELISFLASRIESLGTILYDQIKPQQQQINYNAQP